MRKEVEILEGTNFTHEKVVDEDMKRRELVVYRIKSGAVRQARPSNT